MLEELKNVLPAIDPAAVMREDAALTVKDGRMFARKRSLAISQPTDLDDFTVESIGFAFHARKVQPTEVKVTEKSVLMKNAIRQSRLKRIEPVTIPNKPKIDTQPAPEGLVEAIQTVLPFASSGSAEAEWTMGARIDKRCLTASNMVTAVRADLPAKDGFDGVTLSSEVLSYIVSRGDLVAWGVSSKAVLLEFEDGAWALAARLTTEMPDYVVNLLDQDISADFEITDDYREQLLASVEFTSDIIHVRHDHLTGTLLSSEHKCWIESEVGEKEPMFTARDLALVIRNATAIDYTTYPNPSPFLLPNGRGLIAGRIAT